MTTLPNFTDPSPPGPGSVHLRVHADRLNRPATIDDLRAVLDAMTEEERRRFLSDMAIRACVDSGRDKANLEMMRSERDAAIRERDHHRKTLNAIDVALKGFRHRDTRDKYCDGFMDEETLPAVQRLRKEYDQARRDLETLRQHPVIVYRYECSDAEAQELSELRARVGELVKALQESTMAYGRDTMALARQRNAAMERAEKAETRERENGELLAEAEGKLAKLDDLTKAWAIEGDYTDGEELHMVLENIIRRSQDAATAKMLELQRWRPVVDAAVALQEARSETDGSHAKRNAYLEAVGALISAVEAAKAGET